jgi:hypothetical protein
VGTDQLSAVGVLERLQLGDGYVLVDFVVEAFGGPNSESIRQRSMK